MPSIPLGRATALLALISLALAATANAAAPPPVTVAVHPATGSAGSYFDIPARPGSRATAGTLELHNTARRPLTVLIDPVGSLTASTLGSAYAMRVAAPSGSATWSRVGSRRLVLAPHATRVVPVSVAVPAAAGPGDYLSGVTVQALTKPAIERAKGNVAIASVQRYAVGLLVRVPGARHPLIELTHAAVRREPAGTTFYVYGRNAGNSVLENVHGSILVTRRDRVVARTPVGPGTFVTGTSIAYPLLARGEQPHEGSAYRVRATMRYGTRVARLDQQVQFGHRDAVRQQEFGGPRAESRSGIWGKLLLAAALLLLALGALGLIALLRRRRGALRRATPRLVKRVVAEARSAREPLTALRISGAEGREPDAMTVRILRRRIRHGDLLLRVPGKSVLVLAPGTDVGAAATLAAEARRYLTRRGPGAIVVEIVPLWPDALGDDLLTRPATAWSLPEADRADSPDLDSIGFESLLDERAPR